MNTPKLIQLAKDRIREDRAAAPKQANLSKHNRLLRLPINRTSVRKLHEAGWLTTDDVGAVRQNRRQTSH
jgi:hypothetical protein